MRGCCGSKVRPSSAIWADKRGALLAQAADQLVVGDLGDVEHAAGLDHLAQQLRLGTGIRLDGARIGELGVEIGELLGVDGDVVGAHQQAVLAPEGFDLGLRFVDLLAQRLDGARQPGAGRARGALLRRLLRL